MGFIGWMGDGASFLSVDEDAGTARFRDGLVDTGRVPAQITRDGDDLEGVLNGAGVSVQYRMPTREGARGVLRVSGAVSRDATPEVFTHATGLRAADWPVLADRIQTLIDGFAGRAAVAVRDLSVRDGAILTLGDPTMIRTASANKMSALIEVLRQVDTGILDLDRVYRVTEDDFPWGGSYLYENHLLPIDLTLRQLLEYMIYKSDNTATAVCMNIAGRANIRGSLDVQNLRDFSLPDDSYTSEESAVWAGDHWRDTYEGYSTKSSVTATDLVQEVTGLWFGGSLSGAARDEALRIMLGTEDSGRMRWLLPPGRYVAHKAGSLSGAFEDLPPTWTGFLDMPGISNDAGIVTVGGHEYALAVLTEGDNATGTALIRSVSLAVFNHAMGVTPEAPVPTAAYYVSSDGPQRIVAGVDGRRTIRVP